MSPPAGSALYNYDANGNALIALSTSGGSTPVATVAAMQALSASQVTDGQLFMSKVDGSLWRYVAASVLTSDTGTSAGPVLVATATTAGVGAFLRIDNDLDISLAIGFGTADAAVLYTVPAGYKLRLTRIYWEVTTSFTGGTSSAIAINSSNANFNSNGDLLAGTGGDVAATLVSTGSPYKGGTLGTKYGSNGVIVLVGGDTVKFQRITSVFTAGAGFIHLDTSAITVPAA